MSVELGQPRAQSARGIGGVVGLGDGADDHDASRPGIRHLVDRAVIDPSDCEPGEHRAVAAVGLVRRAHEVEPDAGAPRLGRRGPHRPDAEVAEVDLGAGGGQLSGVMGRESEGHVLADDPARARPGQIALAEVQDRGCRGGGDVGAIVDRPQPAVPLGDLAQDAEELELLSGFEPLVAQLDDVDPAREGGIDEVGEVSAVAAGVGAEVQLSVGEEHPASVSASADVVVIGAGVIGLAIAWELVRAGRDVRVVDPEPATGATHAAAGMIAPISEERLTEPALHALAVASSARYPEFVASLPGACGYEDAATLLVAVDDADRRMLDDIAARHPSRVEALTTREVRRLEPLIGPRASAVRRAHEHRVDPRALAARLREALGDRVVRARATGIRHADQAEPSSPATGVHLDGGGVLAAREVVVAAALGAAGLAGLPIDARMRPVYGDILRLSVPARLRPFLAHTVRASVRGASVYLVPRRDGTVVVGATQREHGGAEVSAGGVHELLRDAATVVPAVLELSLREATARARPVTPDNAPLLGRVAPGLIMATGFGRHGVMLAPIAAAVVAGLAGGAAGDALDGAGRAGAAFADVLPSVLEAFRPDRFTSASGPGMPDSHLLDPHPLDPVEAS